MKVSVPDHHQHSPGGVREPEETGRSPLEIWDPGSTAASSASAITSWIQAGSMSAPAGRGSQLRFHRCHTGGRRSGVR